MDFSSVADDFYVNMNLQTTLSLPNSRETILHFVEAVQKEYRQMTSFYQRESGEFILEGDRDSGVYQWMELQSHRLSAGFFNPPSLEEAYALHRWLLERSVYFLGVGGIDVDALDVLYGFNLDYRGNRDSLVAQALLGGSPLGVLATDLPGPAIEFEPNMVITLNDDCYLQARLSMETHSNSYQVRTGQYDDEPVSIYFTVRQYPKPGQVLDINQSFRQQCRIGEDLTAKFVVPQIIRPISAAIASGQ